nr:translation initiation factor IF-2-like [Caretta caretta]
MELLRTLTDKDWSSSLKLQDHSVSKRLYPHFSARIRSRGGEGGVSRARRSAADPWRRRRPERRARRALSLQLQEPVGLGGSGLLSAGRRWRRVQERAAARAPLGPVRSARPPACDGCCLTHIPGGALRRGLRRGGRARAERRGAAVRRAGGRGERRCGWRWGPPLPLAGWGSEGSRLSRGRARARSLLLSATLTGLRPWHTHNRTCCHRPQPAPRTRPLSLLPPPGRAASLAPAAGKWERRRPSQQRYGAGQDAGGKRRPEAGHPPGATAEPGGASAGGAGLSLGAGGAPPGSSSAALAQAASKASDRVALPAWPCSSGRPMPYRGAGARVSVLKGAPRKETLPVGQGKARCPPHPAERGGDACQARNCFSPWTWSQYPPNLPKAASWTRQAEKGPPLHVFQ